MSEFELLGKRTFPSVVVIRDGVVDQLIHCRNAEHAEEVFLDKISENISNWDEYTQEDKEGCIDDGYELFGRGSVCLSWGESLPIMD